MRTKKYNGFTVVELIVVIVVIGIIATIAFVSYTSIQRQAREGSVISDLTGAAEQIELFEISAKEYPDTLAEVNAGEGIPTSKDTTYQYTSTATSYCLTGTNGNVSYKISNSATKPTEGGCPGHGVGGVAAITNLVVNPSMASTANVSAAGAPGSNAVSTAGPFSGPNFVRRTFSGSGGGGPYFNPVTTITPNKQYTASVYARASVNGDVNIAIEWKSNTGGIIGRTSNVYAIGPGGWTRLTVTGNAPSSADRTTITVYAASGTSWVSGNTLDIDAGMLIEGSTARPYADGNTANWIWNGTANNATSTGPAL